MRIAVASSADTPFAEKVGRKAPAASGRMGGFKAGCPQLKVLLLALPFLDVRSCEEKQRKTPVKFDIQEFCSYSLAFERCTLLQFFSTVQALSMLEAWCFLGEILWADSPCRNGWICGFQSDGDLAPFKVVKDSFFRFQKRFQRWTVSLWFLLGAAKASKFSDTGAIGMTSRRPRKLVLCGRKPLVGRPKRPRNPPTW